MEESPPSQKTDSFCKVCGDKASGKHYGVPSCDGCRGFFKRSIRRNLEYVCKENGRCVVDVTRRNQCQACRFKKCLQANMKRDAVQHERAPRSPQHAPLPPYTLGGRIRPFPFSALAAGVSTLGAPFHLQGAPGAALEPALSASPFFHQSLYAGAFGKHGIQAGLNSTANPYNTQKPFSGFLSSPLSSRTRIKEDEVSSSEEVAQNKSHEEDNSVEESPSRLELPIINDTCKASIRHLEVPCLNLFPSENIYETAAKLLFLAIKWARTIPSFLQLSYRDQSILLEESWSELFVLTAAQWAFTVDEAVLLGNVVVPSSRHSVLEEEARKLKEIITRLNLLRVDHTEHACLKALVLFKAESRGLCEPSHVELLQDQTHVMLHEYCAYRHTPHHHPHYKGRFGKLLLTLPAVQAVGRRGLEELLFRQTVGDVSIDRLLGELAQAAHP